MRYTMKKLKLGGSALALLAATSCWASIAQAQQSQSAEDTEQVVVTGTSIRGAAPIGSNLITVDQQAINASGAISLYELTKSIPEVSSLQQSGQGKDPNEDFQPNIHNLGGSASNATLILIDGHRFELSGVNHPDADPSVIAPAALERVEVLADGASSTYGSDAVAGVINFITRKSFEGLQINATSGFGRGFERYNADLIWGTSMGTTSVIFTGSYSDQGGVPARDRSYGHGDHTALGGTNFKTFNCDPATVQPVGQSLIYPSPTATSGIVNSAANAICDTGVYQDLVPPEKRADILAKVTKDFGANFTTTLEFVYGNRTDNAPISRGAVTATVFETGAQANPFYVDPPGVTATSQTIRWDANTLLGPGAYVFDGDDNGYVDLNAEYRLGSDWRITGLLLFGKDHSYTDNTGQLCVSCAYLALNGTTSGNGSLTTPSIPGTTNVITQLPLTAANALDVWDPAGTNKTSAAVLQQLTDSANTIDFFSDMEQFKIGADGKLFDLPAGPLKVAFGGEYQSWDLNEQQVTNAGNGPASVGGSSLHEYHFQRRVSSAYGELDIPVTSPDMQIPLMQKIDVDVSGRFDSYNDVGSTFNPKFGVQWQAIDGVRIRYDISSSFVAPAMDILGNQYGNHSGSAVTGSSMQFAVSTAAFPAVAQLGIPGCTAASTTCTVPASFQGIEVANGNRNIQPETGNGWNLGADLTPTFIPGLDLAVTLFNNKFDGANTAPAFSLLLASPPLQHNVVFFPGGATQAQIAALTAHVPIGGSLPSTVYYIYQFQQQNVLYLKIQGLDINAQYNYPTDHWGDFKIGDALTEFLKYDENNGPGTPGYSVLNTNGINGTFPSVQMQMRANFGWTLDPFSANIFVNYTGSYRNWSSNTVNPLIDNAAGVPIGGGDQVHAFTTVDLNLAYSFNSDILGNSQVYLEGLNIFNAPPPFYNSAVGYDVREGNPFGRVISVGLRAKW